MPSPASPRPPFVRPTLAALLLLGACGNRGELYLEPSDDAALEAELERLGAETGIDPVPGGEPDADPAADPSPLVPGEGVAPTPAPELEEGEDEEDEERDDGEGEEDTGA